MYAGMPVSACTPEQIAARDAAPLEEAERVRSFYEGQSAKRPKRVPPRSATLSAGGRRGGDDDLASENVRSGFLAHNWRKKSIMAALTSDARSC